MALNGLPAEDGRNIPLYRWRTADAPRAVIQLLHGLGEHAGRYERFAKACVDQGFTVFAHDHRGHGPDARTLGHFADSNGWNRVVADVASVNAAIRIEYPTTPLVLFGHSMGSYIAQSYCMRHPGDVERLILSGSTLMSRAGVRVGYLIASLFAAVSKRGRSRLLNFFGIGFFNRKFSPARTEQDWLSRDTEEVDKFVADPLCGGPYSNALWRDLSSGLMEVSSKIAISRIPSELPTLITGGGEDPIGGNRGMGKLHSAYADTGHSDLALAVYEGGRHEMLNETNRNEFTADVLDWVRART